MPSTSEQTVPRCLLCGMHCPIGAEADALGHVRTVFPRDLGFEAGACVLGLTAARLSGAEDRLFRASVGDERCSARAATEALAGRLRAADPERVAAIVDLNRPLEGIAAAAALRDAALAGARLAAFVPPQDGPLLSAGVGGCPPFEKIGGCDLIVTIGDVCSSHPAVARRLRDAQRADRRHRWIALDAAPGRSTRSADQFTLAPPGAVAGMAAALAVACGAQEVGKALGGLDADGICGRARLDAEAVRRVAGALGRAERPAVVVSCSPGRFAHPAAVVAAARELARAAEAGFYALAVCTSALALPALAERLLLQPMAEVLGAIDEGGVDVLLVVGFDPSSVYPTRIRRTWRERCEAIAWAGGLGCAFAEAADVVLPLAFAWEEDGTVVGPQGGPEAHPAWMPAPEGVLTAEGLMRELARQMAAPIQPLADLSDLRAGGEEPPLAELLSEDALDVAAPAEGRVTVLGATEPQGYTGGLSSGGARWQRRIAGEERALCTGGAAGGLEVAQSGAIRLGAEGAVAVPARVAGASPDERAWQGAAVAVPTHWAAARELLKWRADGKTGPIPVPTQREASRSE